MRAGRAHGNVHKWAHPCSQAHRYVQAEDLVSNAIRWIYPSLQPSICGAKAYLSLIKQMPELRQKRPATLREVGNAFSLHCSGGFWRVSNPRLVSIVNCFEKVWEAKWRCAEFGFFLYQVATGATAACLICQERRQLPHTRRWSLTRPASHLQESNSTSNIRHVNTFAQQAVPHQRSGFLSAELLLRLHSRSSRFNEQKLFFFLTKMSPPFSFNAIFLNFQETNPTLCIKNSRFRQQHQVPQFLCK